MDVRVELLGAPRVRTAGTEVLLPATLPGALLGYLAARGTWVSRDELALVFRPDVSDAEARRGLRKLVFRARAMPFAEGLEAVEDRLRWPVPCDLVALRADAAAGRNADVAAVAFASPFEPFAPGAGPGFEAWVELERVEAAATWRRASLAHAAALEATDPDAAVRTLERVLAHDPVDEVVVQELMRLLGVLGERSRALAWFDTFASRLGAELGVAPLESTLALADDLRRRPVEAAAPPPARLPRPADELVGRDEEVARVVAYLGAPGALVSVVGLGGVGKTRLALAVADRIAPRLAHGAVEVAFGASAGRPAVEALAAALGVRGDDPVELRTRVHARLSGMQALLLLDEADAARADDVAEELATLREVAPGLRVLVTARRPLDLAHERPVRVDGLGVPQDAAPEALRRSPAVALFLARAARVAPDLVDDDATVRAAADLCRTLGGHPLAIELAAAWTRTLPVDAISDELRRGGDVLRTTAPDVPERHRSVHALVARAWSDLGPDLARALLALLAFRGRWSLSAGRAVADADNAAIVELVSRSLVRRVGADRFETLELVRVGAPAPVPVVAVDRHAQWTLRRVSERRAALRGGDRAALDELEEGLPDLRAAWSWALAHDARALLEGALDGIDVLVAARGRAALVDELYRPAVAALEADAGRGATEERADRDRLRARILARVSNRERHRGATEAARALARTALEAAPPDSRAAREARLELATLDEAVHAFPAAAAGYRAVLADLGPGDDDLAACAHGSLSNVLFAMGDDVEQAMRHADEGVRRARASGDADLVGITLINLGAGHYDLGSLGAAERCWREAAELAAATGAGAREAAVRNNLAALSERRGDAATAEAAYARSLEVRRALGDDRGVARTLLHLGRLRLAAGLPAEADAHLEEATSVYGRVDAPADLAWALATHARVRLELGDAAGAARRIERSLRLGRLARDDIAVLAGLLATAGLRAHAGATTEAAALAREVAVLAAGRADGVRASADELLIRLGLDAATPPPEPVRDDGRRERLETLVRDALDAVSYGRGRPASPAPARWNGEGTRGP